MRMRREVGERGIGKKRNLFGEGRGFNDKDLSTLWLATC